MNYAEWIEMFLDRHDGRVRGRCEEATLEMATAFPELRRVPGFVFSEGRQEEHWWCETPAGEVVDPTVSQYRGVTCYVPWRPGDKVAVGRCMNCGDVIYRAVKELGGTRESICSEDCATEIRKVFG